MIKSSWIWGIVIALLLATSPFLYDRWSAENNSGQYEIVIPYESISAVAEKSSYSTKEIISKLKESGLTKISVEPITLDKLMSQNIIAVNSGSELAQLLHFSQIDGVHNISKEGYYISVPTEEQYKRLIEESLETTLVQFGNLSFYYIDASQYAKFDSFLGYDPVAIEEITSNGLKYIFRVPNQTDENLNKIMVNQIVQLKTDDATSILPMGSSIVGAGFSNRNELLYSLVNAGYYFYFVEDGKFKEQHAIGKISDYNVVRLISINTNNDYINSLNVSGQVERAVRAVKERNIRSIFYHMRYVGNAEANIKEAEQFISDVQNNMPSRYSIGEPKTFEKVSVPAWAKAFIMLAGILFIYLASELLVVKWLRFGAAAFMALLAGAYVLLDKIVFIQGFALIIGVVAPTYAITKIILTSDGESNIAKILVQYLKAAAVTSVGIWLVISCLNGNMFITGFEMFRGVILVYVVPIMVTFIYAVCKHYQIDLRNDREVVQKLIQLFKSPVRYWHLLIFVIFAGVLYYYVSRTGNNGVASSYEITFRNWLENTLYVRPRTKEFLIGFPLFVLGLYILKSNKFFGRLLLVGGVMGYLSILNTFTHLHIPLELSVIRTVYGLIFGFIIGLLYIGIYKVCRRIWDPLAKRWL